MSDTKPESKTTDIGAILRSAQNWVCDECGHMWWEADAYACPECGRAHMHRYGERDDE